MVKKRIGLIIIPPGVFVDKHEKKVADFLATELRYDVTFLVPDRRKNAKTPDIVMNGHKWEIKVPKGRGSRVIENSLRTALHQSSYIVLDLRRIDGRLPTHKFVKEALRRFQDAKSMKQLLIITKQEELVILK